MDVVGVGGGMPSLPHRGTYGNDGLYSRAGDGLSHAAEFAYGLGAVPKAYVPAVLWQYKHVIEPWEATQQDFRPAEGEGCWNAFYYPHRAVYAFVNWPVGVEPKNPAEVMPKAMVDTVHGYFVSRAGWADGGDVLVTNLLNNGQEGYHRVKDDGKISIWGLGLRGQWSTDFRRGRTVHYAAAEDGSTVTGLAKDGWVRWLAVDLSGASGAPLVLVGVGKGFDAGKLRARSEGNRSLEATTVKAGDVTYTVVILAKGAPPEATADGDGVKVGGQRYAYDSKALTMARFDAN